MTRTYIQIQYVRIYLQHSTDDGEADRLICGVEIFIVIYLFYTYGLEMQQLN